VRTIGSCRRRSSRLPVALLLACPPSSNILDPRLLGSHEPEVGGSARGKIDAVGCTFEDSTRKACTNHNNAATNAQTRRAGTAL
jgi:hypothetical protein